MSVHQRKRASSNRRVPPHDQETPTVTTQFAGVEVGNVHEEGAVTETGTEDFDSLVEKYHRRIFNVVYRYLGDYYEAADVTQDTFVRAYQCFHQFRGDSTAYTWLYRIAINLSHNRKKQLQRRWQAEAESLDAPREFEDTEAEREIPDMTLSPERLAENKELQKLLERTIRSLPDTYRTVIILRDIEDMSYQDIAKTLGISVEAVKSRLFRARTYLKQLLQPYLKEDV